MDRQQQKELLKETFDTVAAGYDSSALRGDERVLDVACGTGHASLALARSLPAGRVTAVDFSTGMLRQAKHKAAAMNIDNIDFIESDMQALGFPDGSFGAAASAFGIFFVEDMTAQLAHIAATVKPGGKVINSTFQESNFQPFKELMVERLAGFGIPPQPQTWKRTASEAGCRQLFEQAGLTGVSVCAENLGYFLEGAEQWWDIVWNAGFRRMVSRLSPEDQARFKREHLEEVGARVTPEGLWLDVGVLFTSGVKR